MEGQDFILWSRQFEGLQISRQLGALCGRMPFLGPCMHSPSFGHAGQPDLSHWSVSLHFPCDESQSNRSDVPL